MDHKSSSAYFSRALCYEEINSHYEAINDYTASLSLYSKDPCAYNNRGLSYFRTQDYTKALSDFNKALSIDKKHNDTYLNRGNTYLKLKKYKEALKDYDTLLQSKPDVYCNFDDRDKDLKEALRSKEELLKSLNLTNEI